jgi:hypothetical protein
VSWTQAAAKARHVMPMAFLRAHKKMSMALTAKRPKSVNAFHRRAGLSFKSEDMRLSTTGTLRRFWRKSQEQSCQFWHTVRAPATDRAIGAPKRGLRQSC